MGLRFGENIMYYLVVTFSITYMSAHLGMNTSTILTLILVAHLVHFFVIPVVGRFSDTLGRKPVYAAGAVLAAVWGFVAFPLFDTQNDWLIVGILIVGLIIHALMYAGQPAIMAEMFPTRMRYSGVSLGYQVTSIVAGSLAPIIATMLLSTYGSWVPVAIYLALAAGVTLVAVAALRETVGISLRSIDDADREKLAERVDA
jgi:MFS family permease